MHKRRMTSIVVAVSCIWLLALGAPAMAEEWPDCEVDYVWERPCVGGLTCQSGLCHCEGTWDDNDVWDATGSVGCCGVECYNIPDYPQETFHHPKVEASNAAGTCQGGTNAGQPCSDGLDCPLGECVGVERYLELELITEDVGDLTIETASTTAPTDKIDLRLSSKDGGGNTLTVAKVVLNAGNGPITLIIQDSARLQTDTTD